MLGVIIPNAIILSVDTVNVVAPKNEEKTFLISQTFSYKTLQTSAWLHFWGIGYFPDCRRPEKKIKMFLQSLSSVFAENVGAAVRLKSRQNNLFSTNDSVKLTIVKCCAIHFT
jgi:hypothetical protein